MKYKVIYKFYDKQDPLKRVYQVDDVYPREGLKVSEERIKELSSKDNAIGRKLITEIKGGKGGKTKSK